jgi:hypothetical protein
MDKNKFLIDLSESDRTDFGRVDFAAQNVAQKAFSAIWELESQVNNGGFDQYFRNSESEIIAYAPIALQQISAHTCAEIVKAAIATIAPIPAEDDARIDALDSALEADEELLEELDSQFFSYPDNLTELLFAFVANNQDEFGVVPS